jgi:hypothetical protein
MMVAAACAHYPVHTDTIAVEPPVMRPRLCSFRSSQRCVAQYDDV